jgi:membrane peptidoglycan carboxypeptidase
MGNEEERPDFEHHEEDDADEDPIERFRRLTSRAPELQEPPTDETLGLYRAGPSPEPDAEEKEKITDSPDQSYGWHGRGHGEPELPEVPEADIADLEEDQKTDPFSSLGEDTNIMAGTMGKVSSEEQESLPPELISEEPSDEQAKQDAQQPEEPSPDHAPEVSDAKPKPSQAETDLYGKLGETPPSRGKRRGRMPPPPPLGSAGRTPPPALDDEGMPLPRRVTEDDLGATRVTPSAFTTPSEQPQPSRQSGARYPARNLRKPTSTFGQRRRTKPRDIRPDSTGGRPRFSGNCFVQVMILLLFAGLIVFVGAFSFMMVQYYSIAATLPDVEDLQGRSSQFETTRILDRNGDLLYEIIDPNAGRRTYVTLDEISPFIVAATVATEDENFYTHPGFNAWAIVRAFVQNLQSGEVVSGASSITQQVARMLFLDPEEANQRTYLRKVKEAILAIELTNNYSKDEILELYLNENFYGNLAYGIEAASETYFGATADKVTLEQAAFLAGLTQAPSVYDVYTNREVALNRQKYVLRLIYEASQAQNCIYVSNSIQRICVDLEIGSEAAYALEDYEFSQPDIQIRYPHWVNYIRTLLEEQYDPQTIYRSGFTVETTLDPQLQQVAINSLKSHIALLQANRVQSGALVAGNPATGEILAMVGSVDFYNEEIDGQINMAVSPRQPGSSIKPITYIAAFEKGWTPATLIWDVESEFPPSGDPNDPREPYVPVNYDERYHGPVTLRSALANSYNVPAVKALDFVGIYDDPNTPVEDGMIAMAHRLGIKKIISVFLSPWVVVK